MASNAVINCCTYFWYLPQEFCTKWAKGWLPEEFGDELVSLNFMNFLLLHGTSAHNAWFPLGDRGPYNWATWNRTSTTEPSETEPLQLSHLKQNLYNWAIWNRTSTTEPFETATLQLSHLKQQLYKRAIWNKNSTNFPSETETLQLSRLKQNCYNWATWNSNSTTEPFETEPLQLSHLKQNHYNWAIWNWTSTTEPPEAAILCLAVCISDIINYQAGMCCKSMNMSAANCSSLFAGEEQTNVAAHEGTQIWSKNNNKVLL